MKIVISLGGSVIVPDNVDLDYLKEFRKFILDLKKKHKIVIVTGGGKTARKYIQPLEEIKLNHKILSLIGIATTKLNARLIASLFKIKKIPDSLKEVSKLLKKSNLVVTGALGFHPNMTSDGTAADISYHINTDLFINITNVKGLFTKDPKKFKNAKLIQKISFKNFYNIAKKIKFHAGQHFVLDKKAAFMIKKHRIRTIIISKNINNLKNCLNNKKFNGTIINL